MDKYTFLSMLNKQLMIIEEIERKKVLEKYEKKINDLIENGMREEDAVLKQGNLKEIVNKILTSYKINPDVYHIKQNDVFENIDLGIEKVATIISNTLSNIGKSLTSKNYDISANSIIIFILKCLLSLIIISVLQYPFIIISGIGKTIFSAFANPISVVAVVVWYLICFLSYLIISIFIIVKLVKLKKKEDK